MESNTKKSRNVHIDPSELQRQKEISERIAEKNAVYEQMRGNKKLFRLVTFGCQQNEADSEKLKGMLYEMGYYPTEKDEEADLILYNTCCVRGNAEDKVFGMLGALKHLKRQKPELIIGICGCMMQQEHIVESIRKKYRHVGIVFGTHTIHKFPEILERALNESYTVIDIQNTDGYIIEDMPVKRDDSSRAWVSIMYGCNNFCSYCIVPNVRGRERSRKPEDILKEIRELAEGGCKEVTLLGQNVNSYGKDLEEGIDFADLLKTVNDTGLIKRIRFMTSHPKDISDKLIEVMRNGRNICEHLHLPVQSGSNRILEAMNRKYTRERYLEIIERVKREIPGIALTSDIIVGFPGETDEDFEETLDIIRQVEFDSLFTFIYSPRKGTPASEMKDVMTYGQKHRNFERLIEMQNEISRRINEGYNGKIVEVLVEGNSKTNPDFMTGRTRTNKIVNFRCDSKLVGSFANVKITGIQTWSLIGEIV